MGFSPLQNCFQIIKSDNRILRETDSYKELQVVTYVLSPINIRQDYLHKTTTEIVKNHDIISVEDLAVGNIMKNHHLAQAMSDVSLGTFYTMLEYKAAWNDRTFIKIDRFFPSSKTCCCCGWKKEDLTLRDRVWTCPSCDTLHERDVNAARNILKQGLIIQSGCGSQSDLKQKREEGALLDESMNPEALTKATA